jgi:hypothetical protein
MTPNVPQIAVVADLRSEKLSSDEEQIYENNFQNQEGAGNKGNLLLCPVHCLPRQCTNAKKGCLPSSYLSVITNLSDEMVLPS